MTDTTPDPRVQEWRSAAIEQESAAAQEAALQAAQQRAVILNVEVRQRDARIAELEAALAEHQDVPSSGEPDA
ncbi:MAG: hypothetical protein ABGW82_07865 [Paracoccus sp. (in: a-proteobacteria)]